MAEEEEEWERTETKAFLQLLTTESDNMEVPPICLTAFQWSSTALFKRKSSALLRGLLKISDSLQLTNASSFPESHCL